jgi:hypothetical protein
MFREANRFFPALTLANKGARGTPPDFAPLNFLPIMLIPSTLTEESIQEVAVAVALPV